MKEKLEQLEQRLAQLNEDIEIAMANGNQAEAEELYREQEDVAFAIGLIGARV